MRTVVKLALGFALLANLAVPPALGAGAEQSALEQAGLSQNFQDYLPEPTAQVPWLNLDTRTKLPKTGLPLGRSADGIERLVLQPIVPNVQMSSNTWSD